METTPDTGGGLSGFIANIIWYGYRYFPFAGSWDWLLLFFALALLGIAMFWPYLWKAVAADMRLLDEHDFDISNQEMALVLWGQVWQWLLVWFFYTDAGKTLFDGRQWFGSGSPAEVSRVLFWISLAANFLLTIGIGILGTSIDERVTVSGGGRPAPYPDRGLLSLYKGGGIFYSREEDGTLKEETTGVMFILIPVINFVMHVFYWYWSAASILLMHTMLCAVILNEIVRMTFVYILHKRTFG